MKTFNKLFLPLLLLSSVLNADDKIYSFIGIQTSATKFENVSAPTFGIKYGKQSNNLRTSISYNYGEKGSNYYQTAMMQIDAGILTRTFKDIAFKPYVGASIGIIQQNDDSLIPSRDRGYVYGANTGFTYILSDAIDLDLGYRFLKTLDLENLDEIQDVTFSMHYFY